VNPIRPLAALSLAVLLALPACQPRGAAPSREAARSAAAPTLEQLKNAAYLGLAEADACTLSAGRWEGVPAAGDSPVRPSVVYAGDFRLAGDLDGDGFEESVALLAASSGGTGENLYLAVVGTAGDTPRQLAIARIGDRVRVRDVRLDSNVVTLDVLQSGPEDPMCCPGELATRRWVFEGGALAEQPSDAPPSRLTLNALGGVAWTLTAWDFGEPAPPEPSVTLEYRDGRIAGVAACNHYGAALTAGDGPGQFTVGPVVSTRKRCAPPVMDTEARYLALLPRARRFSFAATQLAITYDRPDGGMGTMYFAREAGR